MRTTALIALLFLASSTVPSTIGAQNRPYPPPPPPNDPWNYNQSGPNNWDRSWNDRPFPRQGACFFTTAGFSGNRFCVRSGERLPSLPGNFGDNISAIQVFGRHRVQVFNDRNFTGGSTIITGQAPDLRRYRFRGGHTWNNRISSIIVY